MPDKCHDTAMNISFKQLRCFVAVAQHHSFTRAAQVLHTTQSAVSLTVKELEDEVGFRLFDRTTRQVVLSESGQDFYRLAHRLLDEFQTVLRDASDIAALRVGVVRVGATEAAACSLIVPAISAYYQERPGIEVKLVITLVSSMFSALRSGDVDFILGPDSMLGDEMDRTIVPQYLAKSPIRLWCPPDHALAQLEHVSWEAVLGYDLISPAVDFSSRIIPAIMGHMGGEKSETELYGSQSSRRSVSNITAALSMAKVGLGVTFAAEYIRPLATAFGLVGRPLVEPEIERELVLYARRGRALSPAAADFREFLRGFLQTVKMA